MTYRPSPQTPRGIALGIIGLLGFWSGFSDVWAQDAGSLLRERERQQEMRKPERLPAPAEERPARPAQADEKRTVTVRQLLFYRR